MNNITYRLTHLFIAWGTVGLIYETSSLLQNEATILHPSIVDQLIVFSPHAIWPYLSFFIIIPLSFLYAPLSNIRWMSLSFILASFIAGLIYITFPTTMNPQIDYGTSISSQLLSQLISIDTSNNCLPSLHVALTIIVVWGYIQKKHPIKSLLFIIWGIVICFSILQLARHLFIDLITGAILAIIVSLFIQYLQNKIAASISITKNKEI